MRKLWYSKKYKDVEFTGPKRGKELASYYQNADVFVFPSLTDTFGVVMIEALASGLPVAAYNVTGPKDVVINGTNGYIGDNLKDNVIKCANLKIETILKSSQKYQWSVATDQFLETLVKAWHYIINHIYRLILSSWVIEIKRKNSLPFVKITLELMHINIFKREIARRKLPKKLLNCYLTDFSLKKPFFLGHEWLK